MSGREHFIVYALADGAVKRAGICQPGMAVHQARAGEGAMVVPGMVDPDCYTVCPVTKTLTGHERRPLKHENEEEFVREAVEEGRRLTESVGATVKTDAVGLEALRKAVAHWEKVARGEAADNGPLSCSLCRLYFNDFCQGCPVYQKIGRPRCGGPHYLAWLKVTKSQVTPVGGREVRKGRGAIAARAIVTWLRSILQEAEQNHREGRS